MAPHGESEKSIRVLVVNNSGMIREGFCRLLESFPGIQVVASTDHLHDLGEIARQQHIDVALVDALLPQEACFQATRQLRENGSTIRVVILSVSNGIHDVRRALESGASGFLLQDAGPTELEMALHAAATGKKFLCPTIIRQLTEGAAPEDVAKRVAADEGMAQGHEQVDAIINSALRLGILRGDV